MGHGNVVLLSVMLSAVTEKTYIVLWVWFFTVLTTAFNFFVRPLPTSTSATTIHYFLFVYSFKFTVQLGIGDYVYEVILQVAWKLVKIKPDHEANPRGNKFRMWWIALVLWFKGAFTKSRSLEILYVWDWSFLCTSSGHEDDIGDERGDTSFGLTPR